MGNRVWTKEEKQFFDENWGIKSIPYIANKLNRSVCAIQLYASRNGYGPYLDSGDYITVKQLFKTVGLNYNGGFKTIWIEKRKLPARKRKIIEKYICVISIEDFWKWAEKNQELLNFTKFERGSLGAEPEWAATKRKKDFSRKIKKKDIWSDGDKEKLKFLLSMHKYSYADLCKIFNRTECSIKSKMLDLGLYDRPEIKTGVQKVTDDVRNQIKDLIVTGCEYPDIADRMNRSEGSVRSIVFRMFGSQNLVNARKRLEDENYRRRCSKGIEAHNKK